MERNGNGGLIDNQDSRSIDEILTAEFDKRVSAPIRAIPVVAVGAHGAGKDSILNALAVLRGTSGIVHHYGNLVKVDYWTDRLLREGEATAKKPGAKYKPREEILREEQKYVFWYTSKANGYFYGFPPDVFDLEGVPMLHIADPCGVEAVVSNKTIPNRLTVFIDAHHKADLERRAIDRLVLKERVFPPSFNRETSTNHQFNKQYDSMLSTMIQGNKAFVQHLEWFDAVYVNNNPGETGVRSVMYRTQKSRDSLIQDIALRLNALYMMYRDALSRREESSPLIDIADLHNKHIRSLVTALFEMPLENICDGAKLDGSVDRAVLHYAEVYELTLEPLYQHLKGVLVKEVKIKNGVAEIFIKPQSKNAVRVSRLRSGMTDQADYHVLRMLAERTYQVTQTRPDYITKSDVVSGIRCSLTDRKPHSLQPGQLYSLEIKFASKSISV